MSTEHNNILTTTCFLSFFNLIINNKNNQSRSHSTWNPLSSFSLYLRVHPVSVSFLHADDKNTETMISTLSIRTCEQENFGLLVDESSHVRLRNTL